MRAEITEQDLARALEAGRQEMDAEFWARSVRYVPDRDSVEIVTTRDVGFLIPRAWIGALARLSPGQLAHLEVWPNGSAIELDALDIQISVHGLLSQVLPAMLPTSFLAGLFGSRRAKPRLTSKRRRRARTAAKAEGRVSRQARKLLDVFDAAVHGVDLVCMCT